MVNEGLVPNMEPHGRHGGPDELVLQVPYSAVICDLSRAVYKSSLGNSPSSSLVNFKGEIFSCARALPPTRLKPDEKAYALRSNEDVEMYDVEDDEVEEEAVLDELDGNEG
jgi:hypothetical protein